jgi:hypothetical protein
MDSYSHCNFLPIFLRLFVEFCEWRGTVEIDLALAQRVLDDTPDTVMHAIEMPR